MEHLNITISTSWKLVTVNSITYKVKVRTENERRVRLSNLLESLDRWNNGESYPEDLFEFERSWEACGFLLWWWLVPAMPWHAVANAVEDYSIARLRHVPNHALTNAWIIVFVADRLHAATLVFAEGYHNDWQCFVWKMFLLAYWEW